jgi:aryl-phospho-beta-D-glucosidase BglC (GH1 family)
VHHENLYTLDTLYWLKHRAFGLNCFRVICFDPWERKNGYINTDLEDSIQRSLLLKNLDSIVEISSKLRMYVIINYHGKAKSDVKYLHKFWSLIAPRYARSEFVLYELFNEPVAWFPGDYSREFLDFQSALYEKIKKQAPNTKVILFTFANTNNPYGGASMTEIVKKSNIQDWENCLVGFHPYNTGHSSESIAELKAHYPVFNTEQNIPGAPDVQNMDGEQWGMETMEKLGIGWCAWSMDDYSNFKKNFIQGLHKDAVNKGYYWQ